MKHSMGLIFIALALTVCRSRDMNAEREAAFTNSVQNRVRQSLRDPDSAQFLRVDVKPDQRVASGKVNAKNGFGGFTGYDDFVYADGDVAFASNPDSHYDEVYKKFEQGLKIASINSYKSAIATLSAMPDSPEVRADIESAKRGLDQLEH